MHNGFHNELARDRQAQLLRDSDFDRAAASHVTVHAATERSKQASQAPTDQLISGTSRIALNPGSRLGLALLSLRRPSPKTPGLSGC